MELFESWILRLSQLGWLYDNCNRQKKQSFPVQKQAKLDLKLPNPRATLSKTPRIKRPSITEKLQFLQQIIRQLKHACLLKLSFYRTRLTQTFGAASDSWAKWMNAISPFD
jgi:hypothetical protein